MVINDGWTVFALGSTSTITELYKHKVLLCCPSGGQKMQQLNCSFFQIHKMGRMDSVFIF